MPARARRARESSTRSILPAGMVAATVVEPPDDESETDLSTRYRWTVCGGMSKTRPSESERRSLRYSAWAQARGMAEPDGRPR